MSIFGRKIQILIGGLDSGKLVDISRLHTSFVVRSGKGVDTVATVTVYNIDEALLNEIDSGGVVHITAGHVSDNETRELFKGGIIDIVPKQTDADTLFTINCTGSTSNKFKVISKAYTESTTALFIVEDLAKSIDMPLDLDDDTVGLWLRRKQYAGGFTVYGSALKAIRMICSDVGLEVIIDDLSIRVIDALKGDSSRILRLTFETGLLEGLRKSKNPENPNIKTYVCKSLLFPELRRGRRVQIDSRNHLGDGNKVGNFKVENVEHSGSNFENVYYSTIEVTE